MTAQKELMAMGFTRRDARHIRHLGQMRWKEFFRDPEMVKGRSAERIRDMARKFEMTTKESEA